MTEQNCPGVGTISMYQRHDDRTEVQRAVVTGPGVIDPYNERVWIPVLRTDHSTTTLDLGQIIDAIPPLLPSGDQRARGCHRDHRPV